MAKEGRYRIYVKDLFCSSSIDFFKDSSEKQQYCIIVNYATSSELMPIENFLENKMLEIYGPEKFSKKIKKITFRPKKGKERQVPVLLETIITRAEKDRYFLFINAPGGMNTEGLSHRILALDMKQIFLEPFFKKSTRMSHQQASRLSLPSSR